MKNNFLKINSDENYNYNKFFKKITCHIIIITQILKGAKIVTQTQILKEQKLTCYVK
jgi:hypothetical protein